MTDIAPRRSPKPCNSCGCDFDITEAALRKRIYTCGDCRRLRSRQHYYRRKAEGKAVRGPRPPRSHYKTYWKTYSQRQHVKIRRAKQFHERLKDPDEMVKYAARKETRNAIRRGDLTKEPCEVCGKTKVDAHHDDYNKPLQVRWLCREHHAELHALAKGYRNEKEGE